MSGKSNTEDFIRKAKEKFGDRYDYSRVDYVGRDVPVVIGCSKHGWFEQTPHTHLAKKSYGCQKCAEEIKRESRCLGYNGFIQKAQSVHGNKYDYSKVEYVNNRTQVIITCPIHGDFKQTPDNHLSGKGCYLCGRDSASKKIMDDTNSFINKAISAHGSKYDYSLVNYINTTTPVTIICKTHGEFSQQPSVHLCGCGCPKCGREIQDKKRTLTTEEFIERATKKHGDRYSYEKSVYVRHDVPITITCKEHGDFLITPDNHIQGEGCPACAKLNPLAENDIFKFVQSLVGEEKVEKHVHGILDGKQEIDIYVKDKHVGIEYDGLVWHSERFKKDKLYHVNKTNKCVENNINLIHVFEDEFLEKREIVFDKIKEALNVATNKNIILSSQYELNQINTKEAKYFYDKYSLSRYKKSTINIGAFLHSGEMLSVLSISKLKDGIKVNDLIKNINYIPVNIEKRMFEYVIQHFKPSKVVWEFDRRWDSLQNNVMIDLGFKQKGVTKPNVYYTNQQKRYENKEIAKLDTKAKLYRIWDSGNVIYEWKEKR